MFGNYQISRKIPRLDDSELVWEPEKKIESLKTRISKLWWNVLHFMTSCLT